MAEDGGKVSFSRILSPFVFQLRLSGLYFTTPQTLKRPIVRNVLRCLAIGIALFCLTASLFFFVRLYQIEDNLLSITSVEILSCAIFMIQCSITMMLIVHWQRNGCSIMELVNLVGQATHCEGLKMRYGNVKRAVAAFLVIQVAFYGVSIVYVILVNYLHAFPSSELYTRIAYGSGLKWLLVVASLLCLNPSVNCVAMAILITLILAYEYRYLNECLSKENELSCTILKAYSDRHTKLRDAVDQADKMFSGYVLLIYATGLPLLILVSYTLYFDHDNVTYTIILVSWLVATTFQLLTVSFVAALIRNEVSSEE